MQIKFVDINVWLGGKMMPQIISFLKEQDADIVNIQEARFSKDRSLPDNNRTEEVLKKALGYEYSSFSPAYFDTQERGESGNLILSKFTIVKTDTVFFYGEYREYTNGQDSKYFSEIPRHFQHAVIDIEGTLVNDFNLHGIWGHNDGEDNPKRLKMSEIVIDHIKDKQNVIFSGDFNTKENTKTIENIEIHLTNIFKGELVSTFNMKQKTDPGYGEAVVDFIFVSPDIKVLRKDVPQVDVTDHLPLVVELAL